MRKLKTYLPWMLYFIFFAGILVVMPGEHYIHLAARVIIFALFAVAFNLLFGTTGLLSFGQALFYGIGAYVTGMLTKATSPEYFLLFIILGALLAAFVSLFAGLLALRLTGVYFTMLTLAFAQLAWGLTFKLYHFTGGDDGIQGIPKPAMLAGGATKYYIFSLIVVTICLFIIWKISRSPFGMVLKGIRQNPERVTFMGVNVYRTQLAAYVISAFFSGVAGGSTRGSTAASIPICSTGPCRGMPFSWRSWAGWEASSGLSWARPFSRGLKR